MATAVLRLGAELLLSFTLLPPYISIQACVNDTLHQHRAERSPKGNVDLLSPEPRLNMFGRFQNVVFMYFNQTTFVHFVLAGGFVTHAARGAASSQQGALSRRPLTTNNLFCGSCRSRSCLDPPAHGVEHLYFMLIRPLLGSISLSLTPSQSPSRNPLAAEPTICTKSQTVIIQPPCAHCLFAA